MSKRHYVVGLLCLIMSFSQSCEKSEPQKEQDVAIGDWHNNALVLYAENSDNLLLQTNSSTRNQIREHVIQMLMEENSFTFDETEIKMSQRKLDALNIISSANTRVKDDKMLDKLGPILKYLKDNNQISEKLGLHLEEIHNLSLRQVKGEKILESVNRLRTIDFEENDQKYLKVFVDVYNSSYTFWSNERYAKSRASLLKEDPGNPGGPVGPEGPDGCNQIIILADATGALYGMIAGPVMSVIESAAFSLLASINPPCVKP